MASSTTHVALSLAVDPATDGAPDGSSNDDNDDDDDDAHGHCSHRRRRQTLPQRVAAELAFPETCHFLLRPQVPNLAPI